MFLNIKANSIICFYSTVNNNNNIEILENEFHINLFSIDEIIINKCDMRTYRNNQSIILTYQIRFNRFIEEGVLNYFTLFFNEENDAELKRIIKIIKGEHNDKSM